MSRPTYDALGMVVGGRDLRTAQERLADRIRLVLETQPGSVPWEPSFGCDLTGLVGGSASTTRTSEVRTRVTSAIQRWLPAVRISSCTVELIETRAHRQRTAGVPIAEAALASAGVSVVLEVRIDVETESGPVHFEALLQT
jgi:phage baseplate assembly protein W